MTEYTITIDGYKSGLTKEAVEQMFENQYSSQDLTISVSEQNA